MILIIGRKEDPHVKAVSYGLDKLGSKYVVWYPADPCEEYFFHSHSESEWLIAGHRLDDFKVIWFRRIGKTIIPEGLAEGYREPWIRQAEDVQYTILHLLKRGRAIWVNDWERALRAENKFLQLEAALAAGFIVPETLLSNSQTCEIHFGTGSQSGVDGEQRVVMLDGAATNVVEQLWRRGGRSTRP